MYVQDNFSPYLDPEPIAEFLDEGGNRALVTLFLALIIHIGLFMALQSKIHMPRLPEEPIPLNVEIISFEPEDETPKEEIEQPMEVELPPAKAPQSQPKPEPLDEPEPKPIPEPEPIPEPIPEPKSIPEPIPEPKPVPEPVKQPEIITTPIPKVVPEVMPKPEPEPKPEPKAVVVEPFFKPEIVNTPKKLLDSPPDELEQETPNIVNAPAPVREPVKTEPLFNPDIITDNENDTPPEDLAEELPDLEEITDFPTPIIEPEKETGKTKIEDKPDTPKPLPTPIPDKLFEKEVIKTDKRNNKAPKEIDETFDLEVAAKPPEILASKKAPKSSAERERAIPKSQSAPLDRLLKDRDSRRNAKNSGRSRPRRGGNGPSIPIGGGTRRPSPGGSGWTVAPGSWSNEGDKAGQGIIRDIRCREEKRTHKDCPEYTKKFRGRDLSGRENFGSHAPRGTTTQRSSRVMSPGIQVTPGFGDPGNPTSTVLGDADGLQGQYRGDKINTGNQGGRVRDVFNPSPAPWVNGGNNGSLPTPPADDEEKDELILLKPKKPND